MPEWRVRNGLMSHAMGHFSTERALCGAFRYYPASAYRPATRRDMKCLRCLKILGRKPPKKLREKIARANAELRTLYAMARR